MGMRRSRLRIALTTSAAMAATSAYGQEGDVADVVHLDEITVIEARTEQAWSEALAGVSVVSHEEMQILQPTDGADLFLGVPGVAVSQDANRTSTTINIRGMQDFGRVAVILDGARNNFQRNDHGNQSPVWIEPEMLNEVSVARGPVSNIYGSGAIGGVVAFETKDAGDFLKAGERAAGSLKARYETNGDGLVMSGTAAARITDRLDVIGNIVWRDFGDYTDGNGDTVDNSAYDVLAGLAKVSFRPADFHEIKLGWIGNSQNWEEPTAAERDTDLTENTYTAQWVWDDPGLAFVDLHASGYVNQTKIGQTNGVDTNEYDEVTGLPVLVPAGNTRGFELVTTGFDVYDTARFDTSALHHEVTAGGDVFHDDVDTFDTYGGGALYNPGGERTAWGAYVQDRIEYSDWLEVIAAARYDGFSLDGDDVDTDGDRLSPRITVGVKPFEEQFLHGLQLYGTYAEGYRAPSVNETLIEGLHPSGVVFPFLPNPRLRPETAKTIEIGLNFERNDVLSPGDGLRVKAAWFRNDVDDYIGLETLAPGAFGGDPECPYLATLPPIWVPGGYYVPQCYRYTNISQARLEGGEFELAYDAGWIFGSSSLTIVDGENVTDRTPLVSVPPASGMARLGFRMLDERLSFGGEVEHTLGVSDDRLAAVDPHTLVNLFASYEANDRLRFDLRLNNLLDEAYVNYLNAAAGGGAAVYEEGFNAKFAVTLRFGVAEGEGLGLN